MEIRGERVERYGLRLGEQITQLVPLETATIMKRASLREGVGVFKVLEQEGDEFTSQMGDRVVVPEGYVRVRLGYNKITDLTGFWDRVHSAQAKQQKKRK